jgi:tRNA 2-(methylsulfanyl)-N6-isopentenyladenosine37 hydroxylase
VSSAQSFDSLSILRQNTSTDWARHAAQNWQQLLLDHANCEKKAASTALAFMFAYPEDRSLCQALARLAREELRHFEQVQKLLVQLKVPPSRLPPGRYAAGLRSCVATFEPLRKLDLLLCGALIEARSCERFATVAPLLAPPLQAFYSDLAISERRHAGLYLELARERFSAAVADGSFDARLTQMATKEAELIASPDPEFRFHSGVPPAALAA